MFACLFVFLTAGLQFGPCEMGYSSHLMEGMHPILQSGSPPLEAKIEGKLVKNVVHNEEHLLTLFKQLDQIYKQNYEKATTSHRDEFRQWQRRMPPTRAPRWMRLLKKTALSKSDNKIALEKKMYPLIIGIQNTHNVIIDEIDKDINGHIKINYHKKPTTPGWKSWVFAKKRPRRRNLESYELQKLAEQFLERLHVRRRDESNTTELANEPGWVDYLKKAALRQLRNHGHGNFKDTAMVKAIEHAYKVDITKLDANKLGEVNLQYRNKKHRKPIWQDKIRAAYPARRNWGPIKHIEKMIKKMAKSIMKTAKKNVKKTEKDAPITGYRRSFGRVHNNFKYLLRAEPGDKSTKTNWEPLWKSTTRQRRSWPTKSKSRTVTYAKTPFGEIIKPPDAKFIEDFKNFVIGLRRDYTPAQMRLRLGVTLQECICYYGIDLIQTPIEDIGPLLMKSAKRRKSLYNPNNTITTTTTEYRPTVTPYKCPFENQDSDDEGGSGSAMNSNPANLDLNLSSRKLNPDKGSESFSPFNKGRRLLNRMKRMFALGEGLTPTPAQEDPEWLKDMKKYVNAMVKIYGRDMLLKHLEPVVKFVEIKYKVKIEDIDVDQNGEVTIKVTPVKRTRKREKKYRRILSGLTFQDNIIKKEDVRRRRLSLPILRSSLLNSEDTNAKWIEDFKLYLKHVAKHPEDKNLQESLNRIVDNLEKKFGITIDLKVPLSPTLEEPFVIHYRPRPISPKRFS